MGKVKFPRLESAKFREIDKVLGFKVSSPAGNQPGAGPPGGHPHKRLAPRSGNQFRIGPPFGCTCSQNQLFLPSREILEPVIEARIDRGFDYINGTWVGYKRNYFGAVVGFRFAGVTNEAALDLHILCCGPDTKGKTKMVKLFRIQLRAECTEAPQRKVALVQHTAKRDNGPQTEPPIFNIIPGVLPSHNVIRQISNIRNGAKVSSSNRLFHYDEVDRGFALKRHQNGILKNYPRGEHVTVAGRYDRIQFQYAVVGTSGGPKGTGKGAKLEKGFFLKVVLTAVLEGGAEIEIASAQTPSLVVRGRSPSSYKLDPPKGTEQIGPCMQLITEEVGNDKENKFPSGSKKVPATIGLRSSPEAMSPSRSVDSISSSPPAQEKEKKFQPQNLHPSFFMMADRQVRASFHSTTKGNQNSLLLTIAWGKEKKQDNNCYGEHLSFAFKEDSLDKLNLSVPRSPVPAQGIDFWPIVPLPPSNIESGVRKKSAENPFQIEATSLDYLKSTSFLIRPDNCLSTLSQQAHSIRSRSGGAAENPRQSTSYDRLDKAMKTYEATKVGLAALDHLDTQSGQSLVGPTFNSSMLPFSLYVLDHATTSTPVRTRVSYGTFDGVKSGTGKIERCTHGMKKKHWNLKQRKYYESDFQNTEDFSFLRFRNTLNHYQMINYTTQSPVEPPDLPLSSVASVDEYILLASSLIL